MTTPAAPQIQSNDVIRAEYDKLVQEREELFQERLRLFGLKPTVYVRNLDPTTTEAELKQWFQQSGPIKDVRLQLDPNGVSTCTAFIEFYYINSCEDACKRFNEQYRDKSSAQPLQVQFEKKFQIAHQTYKAHGYRLLPNGLPQTGQGYDQHGKGGNQQQQPQQPRGNAMYHPHSYPQHQQQQYPQQPQQQYRNNQYPNPHNNNNQGQQSSAPQSTNHIIVAPNGDTNAIYVANLSPHVTVEQLKTVFADFGLILDLKLILDKGFAFITFGDIATAKLALSLHGQTNQTISKRNTTLVVQLKGQSAPKK